MSFICTITNHMTHYIVNSSSCRAITSPTKWRASTPWWVLACAHQHGVSCRNLSMVIFASLQWMRTMSFVLVYVQVQACESHFVSKRKW